MPTPCFDDLHDHISALTERWLATDDEIRSHHDALAQRPGGDEETWTALVAARERQCHLATGLGTAIGRWLASGGDLVLEEAADEDHAHQESDDAEPLQALAPAATETAPETTTSGSTDHPLPEPEPEPGPEPEPEPLRSPAPAATPEQLRALVAVGIGGRAAARRQQAVDRGREHLDLLSDLTDRPFETATMKRVSDWLDAWSVLQPLGTELNRPLSVLVWRLRALQDRSPSNRVDQLIRGTHKVVGECNAGFVPGLRRSDRPQGSSWDEDADAMLGHSRNSAGTVLLTPEEALQPLYSADLSRCDAPTLRALVIRALDQKVPHDDKRLLKLLAGRRADLKGEGRLKRVRRALRAFEKAQMPMSRPSDWPPEDWPLWHLTRGRTAVIVGGDPRPRSRDQIRQAFEFAHVEWAEHDKTYLDRLQQRAESGSVDVFLFIRFGKHIVDDKVLRPIRGDLSRWVRVDHGYGVSEIRRCMERHWRALAESPADPEE